MTQHHLMDLDLQQILKSNIKKFMVITQIKSLGSNLRLNYTRTRFFFKLHMISFTILQKKLLII